MKRYIKSYIKPPTNKIETLARDIDQYMSDMNPYEYYDVYDSFEGNEDSYDDILQMLLSGRKNELVDYLETDIYECSDDKELVQDATSLIRRINQLQFV